MKYTVTFALVGSVDIEADSEQSALEIANGYGYEDVEWADDFLVTDVEESDL